MKKRQYDVCRLLYDLDKFKWQFQHSGLLDNLKINSSIMDTAVKNDVALLDLALIWMEHVLSNPCGLNKHATKR